MSKTNMDLSELLAKHDQGDFLRSIAEAVTCRGVRLLGAWQKDLHDTCCFSKRVSRLKFSLKAR